LPSMMRSCHEVWTRGRWIGALGFMDAAGLP
jgi:hypothetical protein